MKKRLVLGGLLVLLLVVALTTIGCGEATETTTTVAPTTTSAAGGAVTTASTATTAATGPATGEPIKVGYPCSLTGSGAAPADSEMKGVQLQVDWVNANGGINGRPIELIVGDDQSDLSTMVAVMNKMIQQDKVFAVIGPFEQSSQRRREPSARRSRFPMCLWAGDPRAATRDEVHVERHDLSRPDGSVGHVHQPDQSARLEEYAGRRRRSADRPRDRGPRGQGRGDRRLHLHQDARHLWT